MGSRQQLECLVVERDLYDQLTGQVNSMTIETVNLKRVAFRIDCKSARNYLFEVHHMKDTS